MPSHESKTLTFSWGSDLGQKRINVDSELVGDGVSRPVGDAALVGQDTPEPG